MKRINTVILLLIIILSFATLPVSAEENLQSELGLQSRLLLEAIGVQLPDVKKSDEYITRGDFIYTTASLMKIYYVDEDKSYGENMQKAVENMISLGIVADAEDIEQSREITYTEALKIAVEAVGYGIVAEQGGGWPNGYISTGRRLELNKNLSLSADDHITYDQMCIFMDNLLHSKIAYQKSYGSENEIYTDSDSTVLTEVYDLYETDGIVDGDEYTSLFDTNTVCGEGQISINGISFYYDGEYALGQRIKGYALEEDGKYTLCFAQVYKTEILTVNSSDISDITASEIKYYDESDRRKTAKLDGVCAVLYNGKAFLEYIPGELEDFYGHITLTDNDRDGRYEVMSIWESDTIYVSNVEIFEEYIQGENNGFLSLSEDDISYSIYMNDEKIDITDLPLNSVLNCYISKDGKLIKMIVSDKLISGEVSGFHTGDEDRIFLGEEEYEISKYFSENYIGALATGDNVTVLLDTYGNAAAVMEKDERMVYGYLNKVLMDEGKQIVILKIFTENGKWVKYELAEKVKYDGNKVLAVDLPYILGSGSQTDEQLIRYMVNKNGYISVIDTAKNVEAGVVYANENQYDNLREYKFGGSLSQTANIPYRSGLFLPYFSLKSGAVVFRIKEDSTLSDEERYSIEDETYLQSINHKGTSLKPYNVNESGVADVLVYLDSNDTVLASTALHGLVRKVQKTVNEDNDIIFRMEIFTSDLEFVTYVINDLSVLDALSRTYLTSEEIAEGKSPIFPGDYVRFSVNSDNEIMLISKDFDYKTKTITHNSTSPAQTPTYYYGKVFSRDDNIFMIVPINGDDTYINMSDTESRICLNVENSVAIFEENGNSGNITEGSRSAVITYKQNPSECSTILARVANGITKNIIIYR